MNSKNDAADIAPRTPAGSLGDYYSASQLRNDRWNQLKGAANQLATTTRERTRIQMIEKSRSLLTSLEPIETYWGYPGTRGLNALTQMLVRDNHREFAAAVTRTVRAMMSGAYRQKAIKGTESSAEEEESTAEQEAKEIDVSATTARPYFEVLIVDQQTPGQQEAQRHALRAMRRKDDGFVYEPVVVPSFEDALIAVLFNHNIQTVVVRYDFAFESQHKLKVLNRYLHPVGGEQIDQIEPEDFGPELCRLLRKVRPELDVFLVTDRSVEDIAGRDLGGCQRVFYNSEDYMELHLNILRALQQRYQTPFFTALKAYSKQPTGVFHAMPISRGKSVSKSNWIRDMLDFYGMNIFLAETSATSGGLDSLLEPHGPIKRAQELAARAFGSRKTFFATNGTSTCNKIVVQAIVRPGDIVLVDRDCHKSHHYGMVLAGAQVVYLDSYPLSEYSMYGAVPLREIKHRLLELKAAGKLDRVRMLLLTNCTFDGLIYNVE
ncbi:MAG: ornithine decarboxylase, partial [Rubrivivax sp.]|nr:ornithine decarboxylase [Rubrivivax sp.]